MELTIACQNQKMELSDDWLPDLINGKMVRVPVCRERVSCASFLDFREFTGNFPANFSTIEKLYRPSAAELLHFLLSLLKLTQNYQGIF